MSADSSSSAGSGVGIGTGLLFLVAVASFGGPLALAALYGPHAVEDVTASGGFVTVLATIAFLAPVAVWLRFSRDINGPGGLTAFVDAAVGRRAALVQAALWTASYLLYLLYTTAYVVYDLLPPAWPGVDDWQPLLAGVGPAVIAAIGLLGRRMALYTIALLAVGQVALLAVVDVIAVRHAPAASAFHLAADGDVGRGVGGMATLFVCGSLPLFLGGETRARGGAFRRVLPAALALTGVGVLLAVYPLARDPAFAHDHAPGVSLVRIDGGGALATVVGLGVAGSVVAVMLLEYVALSRLLHYVSGADPRVWIRRLAVVLVVIGPVSLLVDPDRFYDSLLRPSLVLLWLAQLPVVATFPFYVARREKLRAWHVVATGVALALMAFGLVHTLAGSGES